MTNSRQTFAGFACLVLLLTSVGQARAAIAISSSFNLTAQANAGGGTISDPDSASQGGTLNPLNVFVDAVATFGNASVRTTGNGSATWIDASEGSVSFTSLGWETVQVSSGSAILNSATDWTYTFVATATGDFALDYAISVATGTTDAFGLNGFAFTFTGSPNAIFDLPSSGTITRPIVAGQQYTAQIENGANISGGLGTRTSFMQGEFDFRIDSADPGVVPEPASVAIWSLLGLASAGLCWRRPGGALRRSRGVV